MDKDDCWYLDIPRVKTRYSVLGGGSGPVGKSPNSRYGIHIPGNNQHTVRNSASGECSNAGREHLMTDSRNDLGGILKQHRVHWVSNSSKVVSTNARMAYVQRIRSGFYL